jgi:Replication-relaxation
MRLQTPDEVPASYLDAHRYDGPPIVHDRRAGLIACAVQRRDSELLKALQRHKFLTAPQIHELFWAATGTWPAQRRLRKLFDAGLVERFRPLARRGSYPWTYHLGAEGHRLLRDAGVVPAGSRYKPRRLYDFGYVLAALHLNGWVLAVRRQAGLAFLGWDGERRIDAERRRRLPGDDGRWRLGDDRSVRGLLDARERPVCPDAVIELARSDGVGKNGFLIEWDRTVRLDRHFDKFRRYDAFLCGWWWRCPREAVDEEPPFVVFVCQDERQRELFMRAADSELTGHHWHPSIDPEQHEYVGRRRILFALDRDAHAGSLEVWRLPKFPAGHPSRDPRVRRVLLSARA